MPMGHDVAVAALEQNAWSMFSALGRGEGGNVIDTPTRLIVETPVRQPPYNAVWRFLDDGGAPLAEQVAESLRRFVERDVVPMWIVHPTSPPAVRDDLTAAAMVLADEVYGMVVDLRDIERAPAPAEGVELRETTADEPDEWLHLITWRYGLDPSNSSYLSDMYRNALSNQVRLWIARVEGTPVSKVALHIDADGVAGVYGVATTEAGRGRGLASTLTLTALDAARTAGAELAVLHSTPMAHSLYARLGFRDVASFEAWAAPGSLEL